MSRTNSELGKILKKQRISIPLTLQELATVSGVSASHLGRIEKSKRFPSAHILRRIARPLGFDEDEIFTIAGFMSPHPHGVAEERYTAHGRQRLDPYVFKILAKEPLEVQRAVIGILNTIKIVARGIAKGNE